MFAVTSGTICTPDIQTHDFRARAANHHTSHSEPSCRVGPQHFFKLHCHLSRESRQAGFSNPAIASVGFDGAHLCIAMAGCKRSKRVISGLCSRGAPSQISGTAARRGPAAFYGRCGRAASCAGRLQKTASAKDWHLAKSCMIVTLHELLETRLVLSQLNRSVSQIATRQWGISTARKPGKRPSYSW